jgi:putative dimethyl sulfoxide reductase chaperone
LQTWALDFKQDQGGAGLDTLVDDYTRLFIGPGTLLAPPWGSVYFTKDRLIFQEQTIQVRQWYWRFGLQAEKLYQEPDDHIGLELIFVAHLAGLALAALDVQDQAAGKDLLEQQWAFLQEQPLKWANLWCADVLEFSQSAFFKGVAQLIKGMLAHVQGVFESRMGAA